MKYIYIYKITKYISKYFNKLVDDCKLTQLARTYEGNL